VDNHSDTLGFTLSQASLEGKEILSLKLLQAYHLPGVAGLALPQLTRRVSLYGSM
jgi:hypothetical protein